jgi:hypothetical protein
MARVAPGAPTPRRCWHRRPTTRLVPRPVRNSSAAPPSAHQARSAQRCARLASSSRESGIGLLEQPSPTSSGHRRLEHALATELGAATRRPWRGDAREPLRRRSVGPRLRRGASPCAPDELIAGARAPDPTESAVTSPPRTAGRPHGRRGMTIRQIARYLPHREHHRNHPRSVFPQAEIGSRSQLARAL